MKKVADMSRSRSAAASCCAYLGSQQWEGPWLWLLALVTLVSDKKTCFVLVLLSSHIARFSVSRVWDFFDNKSTTVLPHCDFPVTVHLIYTTYFDSLPIKSGLNQHNSNLFNINFIYILRVQLSSQSLIPSVPSVPQLELYSQRQLSLWSDPIVFIVPKSTW